MATGDRHRSAQFVRRVVQKTLLPRSLTLDHRERIHTTARVPDHREEHRGHQGDLEQLAPQLVAGERILKDQRSRCADHCEQREIGRGRAPHSEAVHERQADPDEMEWDRLPTWQQTHRDQVRDGEGRPGGLDRPTLQ